MPLCWLSLLFLAWLSASRAQLKRQRVGELEPAPGGMQGSACSFGGGTRGDGGPTQEPFVLLPWALLLALSGSFVIYLLFAKEKGVSSSGPPSSLKAIRKPPPLFCTPASPLWTCIPLGSTRGLGTASVPPAKRDCPVLLFGFYPRQDGRVLCSKRGLDPGTSAPLPNLRGTTRSPDGSSPVADLEIRPAGKGGHKPSQVPAVQRIRCLL